MKRGEPLGLAAFSFLLTWSVREVSLGSFETSHTLGRGASFAQQDGRIFIALTNPFQIPANRHSLTLALRLQLPSVRVAKS